ncbi:DUF305 domain-containing protein [Caballeronia sp. BCC1704]|uniref:CopM family metallochaperone n=1 Tax=Caballeronia sp. BCC1704 TaxID=2676300 RepID=UPI00158AC6DA|nr:DUF305 domain-containing protein [Caballeronia sp. BCC1704]
MKTRVLVAHFVVSAVTTISFVGTTCAQEAASMPGMNMGDSGSSSAGGSTQAFQSADKKMMQQMQSQAYTGDADKDFVERMIPHHQGAIDMAEVELKYGKDPQLRKLARDIVRAQRQEISTMKRWQSEHGSK